MLRVEFWFPAGPPVVLVTDGGLKVTIVPAGKGGFGRTPIERATVSLPPLDPPPPGLLNES